MHFIRLLSILLAFGSSGLADITHENQFTLTDAKVWVTSGNGYDGDYVALEGDHTGTSSVHIRSYSEASTLYLWFMVISQDDLAVLPTTEVSPRYERTRTDGTFKASDKVEYIKFVEFEGARGVLIGDRFYKRRGS